MYKHASARRGLIASVVTGLIAAPLALGFSAPAVANPGGTDLVIEEVYGGGGSSNASASYQVDFVELYNPTDAPISVNGWSIQYRSQAGTGAATVLTLPNKVVPANDHFLVQVSGPNATPAGGVLPTPDYSSTALNMAGGTGLVLLSDATAPITAPAGDTTATAGVVDAVGYGNTVTSFETARTGTATTISTSVSRNATGDDTNSNLADFGAPATPTPTAAVGNTAAPLAATDPGDKTATTGNAIGGFTLAADGGTAPYSWSATGLPDGITVAADGAVSGTPTLAGGYTVEATVTDSAAPTPATATTTFAFTVSDAPPEPISIAEVQGTTDTTPFANQSVFTVGVVTATYPTGGLKGFYLQTGGSDTSADASDAVFVYVGDNLTAGEYPAVGDTVTVTGTAKEFVTNGKNLTEIEVAAPGDIAATTAQPAVIADTVVPGTVCDEGACLTGAELNAAREESEGELFAPAGNYTVTDPYDGSPYPSTSSSNFGEIGLAAESDVPLVQPTELYDAQNQAAQIAARVAYNDAHRIILDDASSLNYTTAINTGTPLPWLTDTHYVRVGAAVTFPEPVVLTTGFDGWTFLPSGGQVTDDGVGQVNFAQDRPTAPSVVGGDIKLATANVLNYFPTTGQEFVSSSLGTCTYFNDRQGNPITNNNCSPSGPRGAATAASLQRQQDKIVREINSLDASIVSLEEIENSVKFGKSRDFAISALVDALNADAGAGTWAFAPSPSAANLPTLAQQDVIRNGFIYKPALVRLVGPSKVLTTESSDSAPVGAFSDAREPLAQGFKGVGQSNTRAFAVIVNHFKSKGSGTPDPIQGNANDRRVAQANALKTFADAFVSQLGGSGAVFLTGDFNAYDMEDPIQVFTDNGYEALESTTTPGEKSYSFAGLSGSLDHVLANPAAAAMVTGVDIWNINADETVYYEYSRFNYNVTNLYSNNAFRASDHNPEVIGLDLDETPAVDVQLLATNDFHGRIQNDASSASAGAAVMAGAVKQLRADNPATIFAAAGDLIGASTFESFIAKDKPTIDALNEAGLEVSAVGNHEFDQGYDDLVNRVMAPYNAETNPYGGAQWKYLGANVKFKASGDPALDGTWIKTVDGVQVGFIGAVTEHLPELVSPAGISDIEVTDIVAAANSAATDLETAGADVIVLLVHEGAAGTDCATMDDDPTSDFGSIVTGVNDDIDAIVSGHTHLSYNCSFPVAGWSGRAVTERPVVSAGQYGYNLNKIVFTVNPVTGEVTAKTQAILPLKVGTSGSNFNYPVDAATQTIVDNAVANAAVLGAQPLGNIAGAFNRAKLSNGTTENRGGESTLGNLVAEIQRWSTSDPTFGSAQIAFMNPGGLRADLLGQGTGAFPRVVTYKDAANVQPFANTLVNEDLTGAQIKSALEQQWQPGGASRPFLKLGISKGFTYTYEPGAASGSRITGMWLDGVAIDPAATYSVTVNSFLASGGDNFTALGQGTGKQDTGRTDLQAQVDYFAANASGEAGLPVDFSQRAVGVTFPGDAPASYTAGDAVTFDLSSLSMTGPGDLTDSAVDVSLDGSSLGSFPVTTTIQSATPGFDEAGTATVTVTLPVDLATGDYDLVVTGNQTGTETTVPVAVDGLTVTTVTGTADEITYGQAGTVEVTVTAESGTPVGTVELYDGDTLLGSVELAGGTGVINLDAGALAVGTHALGLSYLGGGGFAADDGSVDVTVVKATSVVTATATPSTLKVKKGTTSIAVNVESDGFTPTGAVGAFYGDTLLDSANLVDGAATLVIGPFQAVGQVPIEIRYAGDAGTTADTTAVTITVEKQTPRMRLFAPDQVKKGVNAFVRVVMAADNMAVEGNVKLVYRGKSITKKLVDGAIRVNLGSFNRIGPVDVKVTYLGNALLTSVTDTVTFRVVN